ncbi:hypothetical protein F5148DRAFT_1230652 [Russula earlei]|uniref:Uncharacterized protein n=1 Tax=Russula earlei TaxID=71964 RepID=A0ACC0TZT8_9AGAM|nr:hypothetical protein F5148DRAFT_1230652 [Russula earlei]
MLWLSLLSVTPPYLGGQCVPKECACTTQDSPSCVLSYWICTGTDTGARLPHGSRVRVWPRCGCGLAGHTDAACH